MIFISSMGRVDENFLIDVARARPQKSVGCERESCECLSSKRRNCEQRSCERRSSKRMSWTEGLLLQQKTYLLLQQKTCLLLQQNTSNP